MAASQLFLKKQQRILQVFKMKQYDAWMDATHDEYYDNYYGTGEVEEEEDELEEEEVE